MKSTLVAFGDSWPAGVGASNSKNGFVDKIGQHLDVVTVNLSKPSTSIDQAVLEFLRWIDKDQFTCSKVLFFITSPSRSMYFDNGIEVELHPQREDKRNQLYYKYFYSTQLEEVSLLKNLILVQDVCNKLNIPLLFVYNFTKPISHNLLDMHMVYNKTLMEILGMDSVSDSSEGYDQLLQNKKYISEDLHPNDLGHSTIADELTHWIIDVQP
jgi:lysophospholipase L1-like esterase